jgi:hypothetical protein
MRTDPDAGDLVGGSTHLLDDLLDHLGDPVQTGLGAIDPLGFLSLAMKDPQLPIADDHLHFGAAQIESNPVAMIGFHHPYPPKTLWRWPIATQRYLPENNCIGRSVYLISR